MEFRERYKCKKFCQFLEIKQEALTVVGKTKYRLTESH